MKKLIVLLIGCLSVAQVCVAQDVIVTRDSKRIDAKVEEISETEVRYHRQDNPDGPVFVLSTSQIASIVFANGEVATFNNQPTQQQQQLQPAQQNQYDHSVIAGTAGLVQYTPGKLVNRKESHYYYGGVKITDDTYEELLKAVCPKAYSTLSLSEALGGFEILFGLAGFVLLDVGIYKAIYYGDAESGPWFAWSVATFVAAIPCMIGKYSLRSKSVREFNEQCAMPSYSQNDIELQFGVSPTSVGLTLKF